MFVPISYNVRSLLVRWKSTLFAIVGIAMVTAVLVALLAMSSGFRLALRSTGSDQNAIVLQQGSQSELSSSFSKEAGDWVALDANIAHDREGKPLVSSELVTIIALPGRSNDELTNVTVRGVSPMAFVVHYGIQIIAGRNVTPGLFEVVVGKRLQQRIRGLEVGSRIMLMKKEFQVVGVLASDGNSFESEIWTDFDAMSSAFNRFGTENSLTLRLADPKTVSEFKQTIAANPQYRLQIKPEDQYYEDEAGPLSKFLRSLALFVSVVMGIGAVFGAMNTMYGIIAARVREIGTLRAIGFSRPSILLAFVLEGTFLALIGGLLGCLLSFVMDGFTATSSVNMGEVAFAFRVFPKDLLYGLGFAALMGACGSLLPAFKAASSPLARALRG